MGSRAGRKRAATAGEDLVDSIVVVVLVDEAVPFVEVACGATSVDGEHERAVVTAFLHDVFEDVAADSAALGMGV